MQISIIKTFNSVVKPKTKCESGIGFHIHTPGTKEKNFSQNKFLVEIHVFYLKSQISEIFKKSVLGLKDAPVRL